jgi:Uncharacterised nucleotidyltransferase
MASNEEPHHLSWPRGSMDLLAKAILTPEREAILAWNAWRKAYDIDRTAWNEVRMLGAIASRLIWLEPSADIAARISSIQKFLWVHSEMCLSGCAAALQLLRKAGIPALFLKGLARLALNPLAVKERLIRDADVLVPFDMHEAAATVLIEAGWVLQEGQEPWQAYRREFGSLVSHHAWSFVRKGVEIDLHHFSNPLNRIMGDDEGLWQRSSLVPWRGLKVLVPSAADFLLLALVHGARWSSEANADWTIDACFIIDESKVQWEVLVHEAQKRMIEAPVLASLRYLHEQLQRPVPQDVMEQLASRLTNESKQEFQCYASKPEPETEADHRIATQMAARRASAFISDTLPPADQTVFWNATRFACRNHHEILVDVPPAIITGDTLVLRAHVICESQLSGLLAFTIGIKGLYFFWDDLLLQKQPDGLYGARTSVALPRNLITQRGITGLVVRAECPWLEANAGPEFTIQIDTLLA